MDLSFSYLAAAKSHESNSFQLAPAARAVLLAETLKVSNRSSHSNRFNLINLSDNFKMRHIQLKSFCAVLSASTSASTSSSEL